MKNKYLTKLRLNVNAIKEIQKEMNKLISKNNLTNKEVNTLSELYREEFSLYMENSSIYDNLINSLEKENVFTSKRVINEAEKLLKVRRIDV